MTLDRVLEISAVLVVVAAIVIAVPYLGSLAYFLFMDRNFREAHRKAKDLVISSILSAITP